MEKKICMKNTFCYLLLLLYCLKCTHILKKYVAEKKWLVKKMSGWWAKKLISISAVGTLTFTSVHIV